MFKLAINYEACFPREERGTLENYLSGIAKSELLKMSSFFLGFNPNNSRYSDIRDFFDMFFSAENAEFSDNVFNNVLQYIAATPQPYQMYEVPYVVSSLNLFEFIFDKIPEHQITTKSNAEVERDIFRAYVLLNQKTITERDRISQQIRDDNDITLSMAQALLQISFHNNDLINYRIEKVFYCQFVRALFYFEFLSFRENCNELLEAFYAFYEVVDYKDYLRRLLGISHAVLMKDREAHTEIHLENIENRAFIDKHIASSDSLLTELDFINSRGNPLYKYEDDKYRIISPLFTIEMIYNGLFFRLKNINADLQGAAKVSGFYNLKTYEYSEQYVLSKLLKEIYGNRYIQKSGAELDAVLPGAPDYYMRNGKYIHIFESKDILITKESKQSFDYRDLENELSIKLYENEKGSAKAVRQLAETVRKILSGEATYDTGIPTNRSHIFPILVLHYRLFNAAGMNSVINEWFKNEMAALQESGLDTSRVHDLILIDIETLLFNREAFANRIISLQDVLLEYEKNYLRFDITKARPRPKNQREVSDLFQKSLTPFSFYLDNKVEKLGYRRNGDDLLQKAAVLFDEEE
ncbi:hypothetical protein [Winogradskyella forsetii]|uniref:hypothetical protein n=1 Tax=Winogradskyella forsetii TaxID=2686077 RepID=UPI0015BE63B8|nr:hypothetical protein [Winogradskyella forsetii]